MGCEPGPQLGAVTGNGLMFLSLSPSLTLFLEINKYFLRKECFNKILSHTLLEKEQLSFSFVFPNTSLEPISTKALYTLD